VREKDCSSDAVRGLGSDLKAFSAVTGPLANTLLIFALEDQRTVICWQYRYVLRASNQVLSVSVFD
jgi:hypothetical protein